MAHGFGAAPVLGQESARPAVVYRTFLPADRATGRTANVKPGDAGLVPSPLLAGGSPLVTVYFQFEPDGQITSPRAPTGSSLRRAVPRYVSQQAVDQARSQLDRIRAITDRAQLLAMLPQAPPAPGEIADAASNQYSANFPAPGQSQMVPQGFGRAGIEFN